jgi:hypothetical protein
MTADMIITIIIGLITSILGTIIVKYFKNLSTWLVNCLSKMSKRYQKSLIKEIAKGNQNKASIFIASMVVLTTIVLAEFLIMDTNNELNELKKDATEQLNSLENLDKTNTEITAAKYLENYRKTLTEALIKEKEMRLHFIYIIIIPAIIIVIALIIIYSRIVYINNYNVRFIQLLSRIRPSISNDLYLCLKQDWAYMETREDLERIDVIICQEEEKVRESRELKKQEEEHNLLF